MRLISLLTLLSCIFLSKITIGQHGHVDLTFNYHDTSSLYENLSGANEEIKLIFEQSDGKRIVSGDFTRYNGIDVDYLVRVLDNGFIDKSFNLGAQGANTYAHTIDQQSDGKLLVGGYFNVGGGNKRLIRLNTDGTYDPSFDVGIQPNASIWSIKILTNGKVLVAGAFTSWNGVPTSRVVRLNADGSVDPTFSVGAGPNNSVGGLDLLGTGEIIITGGFTSISGSAALGYAKLNADGSNASGFTYNSFSGVSNSWSAPVVQDDDKVLLYSVFGTLRRINPDGSEDLSFIPGSASSGNINSVEYLSNGQILVGGSFSSYNGFSQPRLVRLNSDGSSDLSFTPGVNSGSNLRVAAIMELNSGNIAIGGEFSFVNSFQLNNVAVINMNGEVVFFEPAIAGAGLALAVQPDNKILVGGSFSHYYGQEAGNLVRLLPDGQIDTTFYAEVEPYFNYPITDILVLDNGSILISGTFTSVNGISSASKVARLFPDGTVDTSFISPNISANTRIESIDVQPDGKVLLAGNFTSVNGTSMKYAARLEANGLLDASFSSPLGGNVTFSISALKIKSVSNSKIMVSGKFGCCPPVVRLNANGSFDPSFYLNVGSYVIYDFLEMDDGKYIISGTRSPIASQIIHVVAGLNHNGTFNNDFNIVTEPNSSGYSGLMARSLTQISDNEVFVTGSFIDLPGYIKRNAFIISTLGVRDTLFDVSESFETTAPVERVYEGAMQSDGRLLVVGTFESIGDIGRNGISRLQRTFFVADTITCQTSSYQFNNQTILSPQSGAYYDTLVSSIGTDSVVCLNLVVSQPPPVIDVQNSCGAFTWIDGVTYTASTDSAVYVISGQGGCDSTVILHLTVSQPDSLLDVHSACGSFTWIDGVTYTSDNNSASVTLTNQSGCDSTIFLDLTINPMPNVGVIQSDSLLTVNEPNAQYQWIDCNSLTAIVGETNQSFLITDSLGLYAVVVDMNGCLDTSSCFSLMAADVPSNQLIPFSEIYPNPTDGAVTINFGEVRELIEIDVFNLFGQEIFTGKFENKNKVNFTMENAAPGVYMIQIRYGRNKSNVLKLIRK
jgi:uncharacterized delta-60 repeat protein